MNRTHIITITCVCGLVLALAAFQAGRSVEEAARPLERQSAVALTTQSNVPLEKATELFVTDIANVPFADLYGVLRSATAERLDEWLEQLEALPKGPQKNAAVSSFFKTLVQLDPKEAIKLVEKIDNRAIRQIASDAMFKAAPTSTMAEMAEYFIGVDFRTTGVTNHLGDAIEEWGLVDPVAVSHFFDEHADNDRLQPCFDTLLFRWGRVDPNAARNWWQRQKPFPDTEDGKRYFSEAAHGLVFGWYNKDRAAAIDYAISNASDKSFDLALRDLTIAEFLKTENAGQKLIERLPDGRLKAEAVENLVHYTTTGVFLGYQDPNDKRSAETMTKWIVKLPQDAWGTALSEVATAWQRDNPANFSAWFAQQPVQAKDRIVYDWCTSGSRENPQEVIEQARNITDGDLREEALTKYALSFGSTADESIKLISKTSLSNDQKTELIRLIRERRGDNDEQ